MPDEEQKRNRLKQIYDRFFGASPEKPEDAGEVVIIAMRPEEAYAVDAHGHRELTAFEHQLLGQQVGIFSYKP